MVRGRVAPERTRQIVAMGGGGFSMEPENPLLDRYVLAQAGHDNPRVCFLATASGDAQSYIDRFYEAFAAHRCRPSHLSLFRPFTSATDAFLRKQHVIYVGGGNTRSMLALWREWGVDATLRIAWERGTVLAGLSAGAICWFEQGLTDSVPGALTALPCLGLLPGSACPHYDGEAERRPTFRRLVAAGDLLPGLAVDDGAALHFVGTTLAQVISSRPAARAYRVERAGHEALETPLPADYLGA